MINRLDAAQECDAREADSSTKADNKIKNINNKPMAESKEITELLALF